MCAPCRCARHRSGDPGSETGVGGRGDPTTSNLPKKWHVVPDHKCVPLVTLRHDRAACHGTLCQMPVPCAAMTTTGDGAAAPGLRERRSSGPGAGSPTRRSGSRSTVGLDHVTVEQIAAEAEVAPRTFFRYFDSKEDALLADHPERLALLRVTLRNRPANEGPLTAVRAAILEIVGDLEDHRELMLCKARLMEDNPHLRGRSLEMMEELERTIAEELAVRMQVDVDHDLRPFVIAGAVASAMRVAIDRWAASGGVDDLRAAVVAALDLLDGGLDRSVAEATAPAR